jgi:PknH-like extracellular domain
MQNRIAVVLAGLCVLAASCSANSNRATPATSTTVPPVAQAALDGLLLSVAQINAAMGTTGLSVADDNKHMEDVRAIVSRPECLPIYSPAEANAYANSGWTGVHRQFLGDPSHSHVTEQSVVLFPTAQRPADSSRPRRSAGRHALGALPTACRAVVKCGMWGRCPTPTAS